MAWGIMDVKKAAFPPSNASLRQRDFTMGRIRCFAYVAKMLPAAAWLQFSLA